MPGNSNSIFPPGWVASKSQSQGFDWWVACEETCYKSRTGCRTRTCKYRRRYLRTYVGSEHNLMGKASP